MISPVELQGLCTLIIENEQPTCEFSLSEAGFDKSTAFNVELWWDNH